MLARVRIHYPVYMNAQSALNFDRPAAYQITVRGAIPAGWSGRLEGMTSNHLTLNDGTTYTILTGELADQSALSGVLNTLYELRWPLVAVTTLPLATPARNPEQPPA